MKWKAVKISVGILISSVLFTACNSFAASIPTPDIPNWGSTPTSPLAKMPGNLSCILVPVDAPAKGEITWRGLTIGVSTFEDVDQILVAESGIPHWWNTEIGSFVFKQNYFLEDWSDIESCFVDNKLAAIKISGRGTWGFPSILPDVIDEYGAPDRVTWANWYEIRSLIWAEKGLLIVAGYGPYEDATVDSVMLFSPVATRKLKSSWVFQSLPKVMPLETGDVMWGMSSAEDPWGIEKGKCLSDCP